MTRPVQARRRAPQSARARADRAADDAPNGASRVREFQIGLFPILVAGDVDGFRRYLGRWEEMIGDTTALEELSVAEQRSLMSRLLRRPQTYNLPPWPSELANAVDEPISFMTPRQPEAPIVDAGAVEGEPAGFYQLDMITGEVVPVDPPASRLAEPLAPYAAAAGVPKPRRRRRRAAATGLVQLPLWSADGPDRKESA